ncbi:MAG: S10 family peptidase [Myxococcota bacterium]
MRYSGTGPSIVLAFLVSTSAAAQESGPSEGATKNSEEGAVPEAKTFVTTSTVRIDGRVLKYEATVGTLILKDPDDKPIATFGYTAYVKQGDRAARRRPITFAFNGGPGSSSVWLHMGVLGPKRARANDLGATSAPFGTEENGFSILDRSDLVFIDPVGTGLSRPIGEAKGEMFWGVDQDVESIGNFIHRYVTESRRWGSPKYLLGESYGAMRAAALVHHMQSRYNMAFSGVVLVSPFLDFVAGFDGVGNDLAYILFLPTLAAVAWQHDAVEDKPERLESFVEAAKEFAMTSYARALRKGARLQGEERAEVIERMAAFTGLSQEYLDRANLRVGHNQFTQELLRDRGVTVGRIDARFSGPNWNPLAERMPYDPFMADIAGPFTAAFQDYLHGSLDVPPANAYRVSNFELWKVWDWGHRPPGMPELGPAKLPVPNTALDLAYAMTTNSNLRILVQQGMFDLATPQLATEYVLDHMKIPAEARDRITVAYYEAGHMMYLHPPSRSKFRGDLVRFIDGGPPNASKGSVSRR